MAGSVYWSAGAVDLRSAALLAVAAMATAPLGARATHMFDCTMLRRMLGYWLFLVAGLLPLKAYVFSQLPAPAHAEAPAEGADGAAGPGLASPAEAAAAAAQAQGGLEGVLGPLTAVDALLLATGCLAGVASGLLGIGGGTIVTPLLAVATGMPQVSVLGTSLCAMVPPALVGLAQHHRLGNVDWVQAAALAAGTCAGSFLGSNLAISAPPGVLEGAFSLGMLFLGRKTLQAAEAAARAAAAKAAAQAAQARGAAPAASAAAAAAGK
jgi:uncharacterized membrane protein YfcA